MFVDMIPVLIVPVAIVDVIDVVPVLDGLVAVAFIVNPVMIGVNVLLLVPLAIVQVIDMAIVLTSGMTVARKVLVVGRVVILGHGDLLVAKADPPTVHY